ncbi:mechanosensitive ion channel family protein [Gilvimarinus chinensis]|uniref:mechanosensitive ion channel family protein n=1 Tax=Gilvimarinus chinensis TaxID=396005 RepID=UPI00039E0DDC|nr:mechanosensitive ion channel family protein [Gilvimarinus chinensis]
MRRFGFFVVLFVLSLACGLGQAQVVPEVDVSVDESDSSSSSSSTSSNSDCPSGECDSGQSSLPVNLDVGQVIDVAEVAENWEAQVHSWLQAIGVGGWSAKAVVTTIILVAAALILLVSGYSARRVYKHLKKKYRDFHGSARRLSIYRRIFNFIVFLLVMCFVAYTLFLVWLDGEGKVAFSNLATTWFINILSFSVAAVFAVVVFEVISVALERYFYRLSLRGSARIDTLLPIARTVLYGTLLVLFGITVISELGIDVTPLLAGAGVIGVAVGFGAQALIKDVLNGFIVIVEDLIQVGDIAAVGGKTGIIEKITLRKVQLRDLDGRVYTVPFSEIAVVENYTKIFSYYMFDVGIAYRESPDEVIEVLEEISRGMMDDEKYKDVILEPIEILGVDKFADSAVVIKARIKTKPKEQWGVGREFNRRMKYAFDERNIEIPFPHQTIYFGEDKEGAAPPARLDVQNMPRVDQAANEAEPKNA